MKDRILEFLKRENKTSAQFAEDIHVQPSGISHILSGRNNPSLDFVIKMLEKYPFLSTEWLIFGKGSMYKEPRMGDLFADIDLINPERKVNIPASTGKAGSSETPRQTDIQGIITDQPHPEHSRAIKIVWFFEDNSFEEFYPVKH